MCKKKLKVHLINKCCSKRLSLYSYACKSQSLKVTNKGVCGFHQLQPKKNKKRDRMYLLYDYSKILELAF